MSSWRNSWSSGPGFCVQCETHWFSLQQKNTQLCFHVGRKNPKNQQPCITMKEKSPKQPDCQNSALTGVFGLKCYNLPVLRRAAPSESDLSQRILLGCQCSPAQPQFSLYKHERYVFMFWQTEQGTGEAAENLTGAWCAGDSCPVVGKAPIPLPLPCKFPPPIKEGREWSC